MTARRVPPTVSTVSLADLRKDYSLAGLNEQDLARDPYRQFEKWFQEAEAAKIGEPNAMTLSTSTREGRPCGRTVLLKGVDGRGFVFFSNYESRKGRELHENPRAAMVFPWLTLERQVIVEGRPIFIPVRARASWPHGCRNRARSSRDAACWRTA